MLNAILQYTNRVSSRTHHALKKNICNQTLTLDRKACKRIKEEMRKGSSESNEDMTLQPSVVLTKRRHQSCRSKDSRNEEERMSQEIDTDRITKRRADKEMRRRSSDSL
jgi:hypothetical protein